MAALALSPYVSHRYVKVFTQQVIGLFCSSVGLQKAVTTQRERKKKEKQHTSLD